MRGVLAYFDQICLLFGRFLLKNVILVQILIKITAHRRAAKNNQHLLNVIFCNYYWNFSLFE